MLNLARKCLPGFGDCSRNWRFVEVIIPYSGAFAVMPLDRGRMVNHRYPRLDVVRADLRAGDGNFGSEDLFEGC